MNHRPSVSVVMLLLLLALGGALLTEWRAVKQSSYWEIQAQTVRGGPDWPKVYFSEDGHFRERDSIEGKRWQRTPGGRHYFFALPPRPLTTLRFDPTATDAEVNLHGLKLVSRSGERLNLLEEDMLPNDEVLFLHLTGEGLRVVPRPGAMDPYIVFNLPDPLPVPAFGQALHPIRLAGFGILWIVLGGILWWSLRNRQRLAREAVATFFDEAKLGRAIMVATALGLTFLLLAIGSFLPWLILIALLAVRRLTLRRESWRTVLPIGWMVFALAFFAYAALSMSWAGNRGFAEFALQNSALVLAAWFVFGLLFRDPVDLCRGNGILLFLLGLSILALGIEWMTGMFDRRATAFFPDPNLYAYFLVLTLPVAFGTTVAPTQSRPGRGLAGMLFLLGVGALILSLSRGGMLGLAAAIGFIALVRWPKPTLLLSALAALPAFWVVKEAFARLGRTTEASDSIRGELLENLLMMSQKSPWTGTGIGNFILDYPRHADGWYATHTHNLFFQFQVELGLPGTLFLLLFCGALAWRIITLARQSPLNGPLLGTAGGMIGILVVMLFDYQVSYLPLAVLTLLPAWMLLRECEKDHPGTPESSGG